METPQDTPAPETGAIEENQETGEGSPPEPTPEDAPVVEETPLEEVEQPAKKTSRPENSSKEGKPKRKNTGEMLEEGTDAGAAKELLDVFSYYDRKKQGKLPIALLEDVVGSMGIAFPPPEKRESILEIADPSGSNFFTMHALKEVVSSLRGGSTKVEDVLTTYRMFDKDDKGFFTKQELKGVLMRFTSGKISDTEIDQIMTMGGPGDAMDEEGNPKEASISKEVFLSLFQ